MSLQFTEVANSASSARPFLPIMRDVEVSLAGDSRLGRSDASSPGRGAYDQPVPSSRWLSEFQSSVSSGNLRANSVSARRPNPPDTGLLERFIGMARELLAREQVTAARRLLRALPQEILDESTRQLISVLKEPVIRRRLPARPQSSADLEWLKQNAQAHRGTWVAVVAGRLVDSDRSLPDLMQRLKGSSPDSPPLLHHFR